MSQKTMERSEVARELSNRANASDAGRREFEAATPTDVRHASRVMSASNADLPHVKLVSNDSGASDNLDPGGGNRVTGAVVPGGRSNTYGQKVDRDGITCGA